MPQWTCWNKRCQIIDKIILSIPFYLLLKLWEMFNKLQINQRMKNIATEVSDLEMAPLCLKSVDGIAYT